MADPIRSQKHKLSGSFHYCPLTQCLLSPPPLSLSLCFSFVFLQRRGRICKGGVGSKPHVESFIALTGRQYLILQNLPIRLYRK